jgi:hypothetical protein
MQVSDERETDRWITCITNIRLFSFNVYRCRCNLFLMTDMYVWYVVFNATQAPGMRSWSVICIWCSVELINPLNAELNPICHLLALLGTHHILHVSRITVNNYTLRISEFLWHLLALHGEGKTSIEHEKGRQCTCNVTYRRVRVTIVAVEGQ